MYLLSLESQQIFAQQFSQVKERGYVEGLEFKVPKKGGGGSGCR